MTPNDHAVPSPCILVCVIDPASGWCEGCLRTLDEIAGWSGFDRARQLAIVDALVDRRRAAAPC